MSDARFAAPHWRPNPITRRPIPQGSIGLLSRGGSVRLRTTAGKRDKRADGATTLICKGLQVVEQPFRRLNAAELRPAIYAGSQYYMDGVTNQRVAKQEVAA